MILELTKDYIEKRFKYQLASNLNHGIISNTTTALYADFSEANNKFFSNKDIPPSVKRFANEKFKEMLSRQDSYLDIEELEKDITILMLQG